MDRQSPLGILEQIGGAWVGIAALLTAILYICGFVSLRTHYAVLGIDIDLATLDHRYLFSGASFLFFLLVLACALAAILVVLDQLRRWLSPLLAWFPHLPVLLRPLGGVRTLVGSATALVLVVLTYLALGVFDVRNLFFVDKAPDDALQRAIVCALGTGGEWDYVVTLYAAALLLLLFITGAWAYHRLRAAEWRLPWLTPLLLMLASAQLAALAGLHGGFFAGKEARRLDHAPTAVSGLAEPTWLLYRGPSKVVLFARAGSFPRLTTLGVDALDGRAVVAIDPVGELLEVGGCV